MDEKRSVPQAVLLSLLGLLFLLRGSVNAQDPPSWDNQLFLGTKVAYAVDEWRLSGEVQSRFKNDMGELDNWFIETVGTWLPSEHWELAPDFRISRKPSTVEFRPGIGGMYKVLSSATQFVNQLKYQADIGTDGSVDHGLRHVMFLNYQLSEDLIASILGGYFYSWKADFTGVEFIRFGGSLTFRFDPAHTIGLSYFLGVADTGNRWVWTGIPVIQFVINLRSDWKYVPAKIINF